MCTQDIGYFGLLRIHYGRRVLCSAASFIRKSPFTADTTAHGTWLYAIGVAVKIQKFQVETGKWNAFRWKWHWFLETWLHRIRMVGRFHPHAAVSKNNRSMVILLWNDELNAKREAITRAKTTTTKRYSSTLIRTKCNWFGISFCASSHQDHLSLIPFEPMCHWFDRSSIIIVRCVCVHIVNINCGHCESNCLAYNTRNRLKAFPLQPSGGNGK